MPSFFIRDGGRKSDKQNNVKAKRKYAAPQGGGKRKKAAFNEEISSDEDYSGEEPTYHKEYSDDEFEDVQEAAFRKAKQLLSEIRADEKVDEDDEIANEAIAHRLKEDALSKIATRHKKVAVTARLDSSVVQYRAHRFSTIAVAISSCGRYVVSCSKDATVVKYDLEEGKKVGTLKYDKKSDKCHKGQVFAVAISPQDRLLVTAGVDSIIRVWNFADLQHIKDLKGHKNAITGLVFRLGTQQLFSCSRDRTVKAWDLQQMGYVDTMFGHVDTVSDIDILSRERTVTSGSQDRSVRMWKVADESQLVFNGFASSISIDCVALINEDHFVTGCADGSLLIWSTFKKKPVCVQSKAHGVGADGQPNWIVSVAARHYTDLIASGSCDGYIRFWKVADDYKTITNIFSFKQIGFVNCLRFTADGDELVCAVGQEHKFGRWFKVADAKNIISVIPIKYNDEENS